MKQFHAIINRATAAMVETEQRSSARRRGLSKTMTTTTAQKDGGLKAAATNSKPVWSAA
jgi:hypothetical protein